MRADDTRCVDPDGATVAPHPDAASTDLDRAAQLIERMERVPFCRWHGRARIVMGSATFLDAFDALSLAFALPVLVGLWNLSAVETGGLIAASYVGQLIGALAFSRIAESHGRVPSAAAATAIMSVMGLGCALAGSFPLLFLCRFVQGIGVGGEMPVAAAYIGELSPASGRGRFFMLYEMIFPVGLMATGQAGTLLVPLFGWKILFLIGGIPGIVLAVLLLRLPESPRWLIGRGRLDEAEAIIGQIEVAARREHPGVPIGAQTSEARHLPAAPVRSDPKAAARSEYGRWAELLSGFYRRRTLIVWTLWASAFFVANSLNNWMPTLYHTIYRLDLRDALRAASLTNIAQVIVLLFCAFCIDRVGRRRWTVASFALGGLLLAGLAYAGGDSLVLVIVVATLAYGVIGSINAVLYLYTPEIYRRACGQSVPGSRPPGCGSPQRSAPRWSGSWSAGTASARCS
jgi:MFS transporter, putative metabolite:H+ symporter